MNAAALLAFFIVLGLALGQHYKAVPSARERKSLHGPFMVQSQATCELACDCARGAASAAACAQFACIVPSMACEIYYYTQGYCSFLGDYTINTCMLPIIEFHLVAPAV